LAGTLESMANRSKVELYEQIRKAHDRDELSIRALASLFHAHDTSLVPGFWTELLSVADG